MRMRFRAPTGSQAGPRLSNSGGGVWIRPGADGRALGIQCGRQRHGRRDLPGVAGDGGEDPSHDAHTVEGFPGVDLGGVVPVKGLQDESALLLDHLF